MLDQSADGFVRKAATSFPGLGLVKITSSAYAQQQFLDDNFSHLYGLNHANYYKPLQVKARRRQPDLSVRAQARSYLINRLQVICSLA